MMVPEAEKMQVNWDSSVSLAMRLGGTSVWTSELWFRECLRPDGGAVVGVVTDGCDGGVIWLGGIWLGVILGFESELYWRTPNIPS